MFTIICKFHNKNTIYVAGTPEDVKDTVTKATNFVNKHILGVQYQPWNAFFSGSVKGQTVSHTSRIMRKPAFCICKNKCAGRLRGNQAALGKTWNGMDWNGMDWIGLDWNGMEFFSIMSS